VSGSVPVRVSLLEHAVAPPSYQTEYAAGMDLIAAVPDSIQIPAGGIVAVPTGIRIEIPPGYEGQVRPRSGLAARHGIGIPNAPGTIDADYRGEVQVLLVNLGGAPYTVRRGDRIAQLVLAPVIRAQIEVASELTETARGVGGFGHTGR
jgi:dUTP pyrophosphatase